MLDTNQMIMTEINHRLIVPEQLNEANRDFIKKYPPQENPEQINALMLNQLVSFKGVDAVYYSSRDNWFTGYARFGDNLVHMYANEETNFSIHFDRLDKQLKASNTIEKAPDFYATHTPWYKDASINASNGWGEVFSYYAFPTLALPNSIRVTDDKNQVTGVIGNNLFLDNLGDFLRDLFKSRTGSAFIIEPNGALIGSSTLYRPYIFNNGNIAQINANTSQDAVIQSGMEVFKDNYLQPLNEEPHIQSIEIDGKPYQLGIFNLNHGSKVNWYLFVFLSQQSILEQANESIKQSIATIIGGMLLTIALATFLANRISVPISRLNDRIRAWRDNPGLTVNLDNETYPFKEIQQLSDSTFQMQRRITSALQELRKKITENQHFITEIEKLAMVAENTDDMVLICNDKQQIEWANESFLTQYGLSLSNVFDKNAFDLLTPPDTSKEDIKRLEVQLEIEGSASVQQVHYDHNGSPHWVLLNIHQIKGNTGEVQHYIHIMQDITAQKNYEQELTKWKTVFYAADWGIAISEGESMNLSLANPAFAKLHGFELNELVDMHAKQFYPDDVFNTIKSYIEVAKKTGSVTFETEHINKENVRFPVLQNISIFHDQQGEIRGLIFSVQDISESKSLHSQLVQSQKMEAMGTLAGGMAHDFNNILASIMGNAELSTIYISQLEQLTESKPIHDLSERLEGIIKSCNRASDLTNKILSYSRMDSPDFENLHLSDVLKESVAMVEPMLPANITIQQNLQTELDSVLGNASQLQQVFVNLMTNAFHAIQSIHRKNGMVTIEMSNVTNLEGQILVQLRFKDNGCGIPKASLAHVFDPFFTTKEKGKGTGLGLSVVTGILRAHSVEIKVESQEKEGTEFILSFPMSTFSQATKEKENNKVVDIIGLGNPHIVMVDDEHTITEVWGQILSQKKFQVTTFNQPEKAWEYIQTHHESIDLLLSDYDMKVMTGAELCAKTRKICPTLPIIMLTGFSEQMDEKRAKKIGIKRLLLKPITLKALLEAITSALSEKPSETESETA
ncbi:PAS domain-containing protein [Paraneptunicella aestuarii]|uniref:PAS domain-containing protein n=1 Tax=Paraneptunicella aestuarii TaxID=2831148 RepID=UPI001E33757F|nr:PAS domain-containing protein [Paraneptunicella aestuarii]UAA38053.1 PAS domain-containing protein [Paraneptunicella aestuarii]